MLGLPMDACGEVLVDCFRWMGCDLSQSPQLFVGDVCPFPLIDPLRSSSVFSCTFVNRVSLWGVELLSGGSGGEAWAVSVWTRPPGHPRDP